MTTIGIFYGSSTGNTQMAADAIGAKLDGAEVHNIQVVPLEKMMEYDVLILGSSTWGWGELQDGWVPLLDELEKMDLSGKKVAFFGTGNQIQFSTTFGDALFILHQAVLKAGAQPIGIWPTEGYDHMDSKAVVDGSFVGLVLDEENQGDLTSSRITEWISKLRNEF